MFDLTRRVALISGAASGIGAATARVFAEAGADLALAWCPPDGHDIEPVRKVVEATGRRVAAAKAGLVGLVKSLAVEFGAHGASAEASYVNGQLLVVDGARSLAGLD
jgi:NAD(P)-dependent dehydrogenase (short-subunit alcohol dehydrogenase family)